MLIEHPQLGRMQLQSSPRAKRIIFKFRQGEFLVSVPLGVGVAEVKRAIEVLLPKLQEMKSKGTVRPRILDPSCQLSSPDFELKWTQTATGNLRISIRQGCMECFYPEGMSFDDDGVQQWLRHELVEALRIHAKVLLISRLEQLAAARGLHYRSVTIRDVHTRWGSCSSLGGISLSLYLVLLPRHLQNYVFHHELTHLVEMNHSPRFWTLLDQALGTDARALRAELRAYAAQLPIL